MPPLSRRRPDPVRSLPSPKRVPQFLVEHFEGIYRDVQGVGGEGNVLPTQPSPAPPFQAQLGASLGHAQDPLLLDGRYHHHPHLWSVCVALQQIGRHAANMAPAAAADAQLQQIGSDVTAAPRLELTPDSGGFLIDSSRSCPATLTCMDTPYQPNGTGFDALDELDHVDWSRLQHAY